MREVQKKNKTEKREWLLESERETDREGETRTVQKYVGCCNISHRRRFRGDRNDTTYLMPSWCNKTQTYTHTVNRLHYVYKHIDNI